MMHNFKWSLQLFNAFKTKYSPKRFYTSSSNQSKVERLSTLPHRDINNCLASSTVAIVSLCGVGSCAAEALCPRGVGYLVLIDMDDICISSTNRQLYILTSTINEMKE